MSDKPFHIVECPPGSVLPKELEKHMKLKETLPNGLQVHTMDIPEGMQVPGPKSLAYQPQWVGGGSGPRNISIIFYSDFTPPSSGNREGIINALMTTANCIMINEANPHMVKFKVRGKPAFIDDEDSQLSILGFIRAVSDQFAKQTGRKINLWREIPCKLNFFEQIHVQNEWKPSTFDWLTPKCAKVGFMCEAHKLNKKLEFITMREQNGWREGLVRVLDA